MINKNILITGIPRSGTTLLAAMIDAAPDTVALNEPRWQARWMNANAAHSTAEDFVKWFTGDWLSLRKRLIEGDPVPERRGMRGEAITNYFRPDEHTLEAENIYHIIDFTRPGLTSDFTLAVKHVGVYLGVLDELAACGHFRIIAILRHPLGVIPSWNNVDLPIARGQLPAATVHWPAMRKLTARDDLEPLVKQVLIYDLICKRLQALEQHLTILKYEDFVQDPMAVTRALGFDCSAFKDKIYTRKPEFYGSDLDTLRDLIGREGEHIRHFYKE